MATTMSPDESSGRTSSAASVAEDVAISEESTDSSIGSVSGQCTQVKRNGQRCAARAQLGSSHCFFHDPASAPTRAAASKRGGERNHVAVLPSTTADYPLSRAKDAVALLALTINQVLRGQIDPRIANAVGYLVTVQLKALEQGETEERLATLEQPRIAGKTKEILKDLDDQVKSFGRSG